MSRNALMRFNHRLDLWLLADNVKSRIPLVHPWVGPVQVECIPHWRSVSPHQRSQQTLGYFEVTLHSVEKTWIED
jgi:hypothetical protein